MNKLNLWPGFVVISLSALMAAGCAEKATVKPGSSAAEKTLKDAERDARSGNEDKAIKEIDAAEQALIKEDKSRPYSQQNKTWSGEDVKATAGRDAIKELDHAKRDAKAKVAGDAADEVKKAIKDVEIKESH
jgi:hypothetical protein